MKKCIMPAILLVGACASPEVDTVKVDFAPLDPPVVGEAAASPPPPDSSPNWQLTASELRLSGLEPAAHRVQLRAPATGDNLGGVAPEPGEAQLADDDQSWRAADGSRYEAMLVLADGTAYGRKGPAPRRPQPSGDNGGGWPGIDVSEAELQRAIDDLATAEGITDAPSELSIDEPQTGILGSTLNSDRRFRQADVATLQSFPLRTIGAINNTSVAGFTNCTGTKIGPRAVLTAAHCVLSSSGAWTSSGWFHPGQTNATHPNAGGTAVPWSGVFARDWRPTAAEPEPSRRRWDYAVIFLQDRQNAVQLGWVGMTYWTGAANYSPLTAAVWGYPMKLGGSDAERCRLSLLNPRECDGWMYGHTQGSLGAAAFRMDEQLEYNIDTTRAQSGSSLLTPASGGAWNSLGTHWGCAGFGGCLGQRNRAARFRAPMFDDVCNWIAEAPSVWASHPFCN